MTIIVCSLHVQFVFGHALQPVQSVRVHTKRHRDVIFKDLRSNDASWNVEMQKRGATDRLNLIALDKVSTSFHGKNADCGSRHTWFHEFSP
jgi:hypothetical protein